MSIDRRTAITGMTATAAGAVAALAQAGPAMAARAGEADPAEPAGRQRTFMMVKGALDDRLIIRWISARYHAVIDDAITPMYNTHSATFSRHRRVTDGPHAGGYELVSAEIAWFTDIATGQPLDRWYNPYIGRDVTIPPGGLRPSRQMIAPDLSIHLEQDAEGIDVTYEVLPFEIHGDDLWITERTRTAVARPGGKKPFRYSQNSIYRTRRSDLARRGARHVTSDVSFTNVCGWRPYLEMGDHPGHMMSIGIGQQGAVFANIPEEWKAATRQRQPDIFADPSRLLAPLWQSRATWS